MLNHHTLERMAVAAGDGPILVALSGGGDSTALLHLLAERFGAARLIAGVVDHALRTGSDADARRAAQSAEALGVRARVLTFTWADNETRSQASAREHRYRALTALAREIGARVIAAGHNRDDQAETVLMRAARGGGWRGLAGVRAFSAVPVWPEGRGLWLARPLLGARREALRAWLRERSAGWIEDPANANDQFERIAVRQALAREEARGFDLMRLAAIAERLAPYAAELDRRASALIARAARFEDDAIVVVSSDWSETDAVRERALSVLLTAASGEQHGPSPTQMRALQATMSNTPSFKGATLGGARLKRSGADYVLTRDQGALAGRADGSPPVPPLPLQSGVEAVWDNRVALTARESGWSIVFENGAPCLMRGEERAELAAASPHWLVRERVQHVLGYD